MQYAISQNDLLEIVKYLRLRPYADVAGLMNIITKLKQIEEKKTPDADTLG